MTSKGIVKAVPAPHIKGRGKKDDSIVPGEAIIYTNSQEGQESKWTNLDSRKDLKGALDNILKFYFWLNFIYHVKCNC